MLYHVPVRCWLDGQKRRQSPLRAEDDLSALPSNDRIAVVNGALVAPVESAARYF